MTPKKTNHGQTSTLGHGNFVAKEGRGVERDKASSQGSVFRGGPQKNFANFREYTPNLLLMHDDKTFQVL